MEGLDLEIFLDAQPRAFAPEARLLDAAEGRDLHRDRAGIEPDHSELERLADAPGTPNVLGEEIGGESEGRVVGDADGFLLAAEAEQRRDRAEGLLAGELHLGGRIAED